VGEQVIRSSYVLLEVVVFAVIVEDGVDHGLGAADIRLQGRKRVRKGDLIREACQ
jgi:hypothetical protein